MPITNVVLVHGYSVRDFNAYGRYASLLAAALDLSADDIFLCAFDSLNNQVTCDDLARALEVRVGRLEQANLLQTTTTAFLCHSTGSIITRRWILNRLMAGKPVPSHFVSLAGANHGSTLAQLGETQLLQFGRQAFQGSSVGLNVLSDLDYGSKFLLRLNRDWVVAQNSNLLPTHIFSLIGDRYDANAPLLPVNMPVFWQVKEVGSDATVRISGSNLNYRMYRSDQGSVQPTEEIKSTPDVAHLILPGYSHTGQHGILEQASDQSDTAFAAVVSAIGVNTTANYQALVESWSNLNNTWIAAQTPNNLVNSTVVFNLSAPGGYQISDFVITILDTAQNARNISDSILDHQPIQNKTFNSSLSFYLDYAAFSASHPHFLNIEVHNSFDKMQYQPISFQIPAALTQLVRPNQCTYVELVLDERSLHILASDDPEVNPQTKWPPLPGN